MQITARPSNNGLCAVHSRQLHPGRHRPPGQQVGEVEAEPRGGINEEAAGFGHEEPPDRLEDDEACNLQQQRGGFGVRWVREKGTEGPTGSQGTTLS